MKNKDNRYYWYGSMIDALRSRKYAPSTRCRYLAICKHITDSFPGKDMRTLGKVELENYFAELERSGASASTINQAISAATFLWHNVFDKPFPIKVRPISDKRLPTVLSRNQIMKLIAYTRNPRDRLALVLAYSGGLRVSEVASLKLENINRERHIIYIRSGKGRKDRVVPLSDFVADMLDCYLEKYPTTKWIFKGYGNSHISTRTLQYAIRTARRRASLPENCSMHTLRHSFATHLVERGENLNTVRELMGHASLSTLQQYIHLANNGVLSTKSPIDYPPLF